MKTKLNLRSQSGTSRRRVAARLVLAAALAAASLQAQIVFDAGQDFSTNQNPNGAWSYGWWEAGNRHFELFTGSRPLSELDASSSPRIWHRYAAASDGQEAISSLGVSWNRNNQPENFFYLLLPPHQIQVHPGPNNENPVIRWTAPFSGVADLTASFEGLNPFGTTTDAHVWHNGTALDTASVNGVGVSSRVGFHETLPVVLGDTLDFGVGNGNNGHYCDSTLLAARIAVYTTDTIIYLSQRAYSLEETNATLPVEVRRFGTDKLTLPVSVDYATVDGTAHAGEDYVAVSGTLHFAAGETNQQIAIPILNDTLEEGEEQFRLVLSNPTGGVLLGSSNVVLRILSDEPMTYYVNVNNSNPVFPFTTWATAATNIQAAVDVSKAGDTVLVTNGIYRTGSLEAEGPNRVVLTNHLLLRSVNGPEVTILDGGGGVRCVHLASNAMLSGFTLRNGMAGAGGGVRGGTLTNCTFRGNSAASGGGVYGGILYDCTLAGNSAVSGGGASGSTLYNCTLTGNSVFYDGGGVGASGAGASGSTLYNCTLTGNSAIGDYGDYGDGGGVSSSSLYDCTVTSNSADSGGGAYSSTLYGCTVMGNTARLGGGVCAPSWWGGSAVVYNCTLVGNTAQEGGGAYGHTVELHNSVIMGNTARQGGGVAGGNLYNCVVTENSADEVGGVTGVMVGIPHEYIPAQLRNCIVYYNQAPRDANYSSISFEYSCTAPLPEGPGNIAAAPQLTWDNHLLSTSPCVAAGGGNYATGRDMDGEAWANPPSMGADQFGPGPVTGPLAMQVHSDYSQVAPGYVVSFVARDIGRLTGLVWDFGDGTLVTNRAFLSHAWETPGSYAVHLTGYNESYPDGVTSTVSVEVIAAVHYVNLANPSAVFPYTSWATAATNIQDAVAAGNLVGRLVLVTNGVYRTGSTGTYGENRVTLPNAVVLRSVNGPSVTLIEGSSDGIRCVYVGDGAMVSGFTLTNGWTDFDFGGGAYCRPLGILTNCVLTGNRAYFGGGVYGGTLNNCSLTGNSAEVGGGAVECTLSNCTLTGNTAGWCGGAYECTLYNCSLTGNSAEEGGGAGYSTLFNCTVASNSASWGYGGVSACTSYNSIVYSNQAPNGANHPGAYGGYAFEHSCTTPLPDGPGNIAADPRFVNGAAGDFRLRPDSPCINAGLNAYVSSTTDLGDLPRIVRGTVDIGAYEFQGPGSAISYAWLHQYGLPTDGSADATDPDADGHTTWQEWRCGTSPVNAASVLKLQTPSFVRHGLFLSWNGDSNQVYCLERATTLQSPLAFSLLQSNISGRSPMTDFTDTSASLQGAAFYRVRTAFTNVSSPPVLQSPVFVPASLTLSWSSVTNRTYVLERSSNPAQPQTFSLIQSNIVGQPGTTTYTDTNAVGVGPFFYRVGVAP